MSRRRLVTFFALAVLAGAGCTFALPEWLGWETRPLASVEEPIDFQVVPVPGENARPLPSLSPADRDALDLDFADGTPGGAPTPHAYADPPGRPAPDGASPAPSAVVDPDASPTPTPRALPPITVPGFGGQRIDPRLDLCLGQPPLPGCPEGIPALVVELIELVDCPDEAVGDEIVICGVSVEPGLTSATVGWRTDRLTRGAVLVARPPLAGHEDEARRVRDADEAGDAVCSLDHQLVADGLERDTVYELLIRARPCGEPAESSSDIHSFRTTLAEPAAITIIWVDDRAANRVQVVWQATPDAPSGVTYWEQGGAPQRLAALSVDGRDIGDLNGSPVRSAFLPTRAATSYWFQVLADNQGARTASEIGSFSTPGGVVEFQLEPVTIFDPAYVADRNDQYVLQPGQAAHVHHWCLSSGGETPYWCQVEPGDELVGGIDPPEYDADVTVFCRDLIEFVGLCVWRERLDRGPPEPDTCIGLQVDYRVEGIERLGPLELRAVPTNLGRDVESAAQLLMDLRDPAGRVTLGCLTRGLRYDVFLDAPGLTDPPVVEVSATGAGLCCPSFPSTRGRGSRYHPNAVVSVPRLEVLEASADVGDDIRLELVVTDDRDRLLCRREDPPPNPVGRPFIAELDCDIPVVSGDGLHVEFSIWSATGRHAHESWTFAVPSTDSASTLADAGRLIQLETAPEDGFRLDLYLLLRWE